MRYLAQGDIGLVYEALRERTLIIRNAPHLSSVLRFVIPIYTYWDAIKYTVGLKLYDFLAGSLSLGKSIWISKTEAAQRLPNIKLDGLKGGIQYFDGQFDDTRLCIDTVSTIHQHGGCCINYMAFKDFVFEGNNIVGAQIEDQLSGDQYTVNTKAIVNATGIFFDNIMDKIKEKSLLKIVSSRGTHIILKKEFIASEDAIMIPETSDGRVLFMIPWHGVLIVGTTDTATDTLELDPKPTGADINFILETAAQYLVKKPTHDDILSTFAGLRPLAAPRNEGQKSKEISRSHKVLVHHGNLFSLLGGKWTTYRKMGYDTVDKIINSGLLPSKPSISKSMPLHNPTIDKGTDTIHPLLPYTWTEIDHMIHTEMVEKIEDLLARRTRCIFINKMATIEILDKAILHMSNAKPWNMEEATAQKAAFLKFAECF